MKSIAVKVLLTLGLGAAVFAAASPANAGIRGSFAYHSAPADVRVWVNTVDGYGGYDQSGYDVYDRVDDVVLSVRASRDAHVTVYVVDTEGFVHVVHPGAPGESAFLYGGRVHEFHLSELGFHPSQFDRGVAFAYAVTSPVPFSFASYDVNIFGPRWGLRISGDPYVASRRFYASLVPAYCDNGLIGIGFARFYVRDYVRYPSYLCAGWHAHDGVRTYCGSDCSVYRQYRVHAGDPYRILHPEYRLKQFDYHTQMRTVQYTEPARRDVRPRSDRKVVRSRTGNVRKVVSERETRTLTAKRNAKLGVPSEPIVQQPRAHVKRRTNLAMRRTAREPNVVRSSKGDYVRGKKNIVTMRDEFRKRAAAKKTSRGAAAVDSKSNRSSTNSKVAAKKGHESKRTRDASKSSKKRRGAR